MSNADFYHNIQKQAATMKDSYPELNQMISGQTAATKKSSQEKPKRLNIQMSSNNSSNKLSIVPSKIEGRSSNKITITKDSQSSNSTSSTSAPSVKIDSKNQNDNLSSTKQMTKQTTLKIKLDPNLIKVRSKSTDSGVPPQSISNDKKISNNTAKEMILPPGFENIQTKPPKDDLNTPPGFSLNIKNESINSEEMKLPPIFVENQNKQPENDMSMPPGFSFNKKEESTIPEEKPAVNEMKPPSIFVENQNKQPENDSSMPPGFSFNKKEESTIPEEKPAAKEMKPPSIFVENQNKQPEIDLSMPPRFSFNKKEESTIPEEKPAEKEMKLPQIFTDSQINQPENDLNMPPGFNFNIKKESIDSNEAPTTEKELEPPILPNEINSTKTTQPSIKGQNNDHTNKEQSKIKIENPINSEPQTRQRFKINLDKIVNNSNKKVTNSNNNEKGSETQKETQLPLNISSKPKESSESSEEQHIIQIDQLQSTKDKEIEEQFDSNNHQIENPLSHQEEKAEQLQHDEFKEKTEQQEEKTEPIKHHELKEKSDHHEREEKKEQIKHHELKEKPEYTDQKEKIEDEEHHLPKEIPDEDHPDQFDQEFDIQFSFDGGFIIPEYEEEEEEEEEEERERIVILPSQLVAQPLEIEKRTPISTNISVETIDTAFPFACYEDLESSKDIHDITSQNQYENYDSSQFPTSYGINDTIAYAFKQKGSRINVFDLNQSKLTSFQSNNLSSITAKDNVIVGSGNKELSFFKIGNETHCSRNKFDLNNATSLAADPLDQTRFFFFTEHDHSLYIVRYNELKTKKDLISNDVLSFDLCSKFLIIVSSSKGGTISCISRKEGPLTTIWNRPIPSSTTSSNSSSSFNHLNGFHCFVTDDFYIEKVGKSVMIYDTKTLKQIQSISHVVHVFKGGGDPLFLLTNGTIIHYKNAYHFPRPVICAVANKSSVIAWYSLDFAPYAKKTVTSPEKLMTIDKHMMKVMHTTIINKTTSFLKNFSTKLIQKEMLFNTIDQSIAYSENEILKFGNSIEELADLVKSMTQKTSPADDCIQLIVNNNYENAFNDSLKLDKNEFVHFLDDKKVASSFHVIKSRNNFGENDNDNQSENILLPDELIEKLVLKTTETIDEGCIWMVERLNSLLLALNDDKRKMVMQQLKEKIQQIIQVYGANVHEEITLNRIANLNQIFTASVD